MKTIKRFWSEWQAARVTRRARQQSADRATVVALRMALNGCR